jgi:hypothetical protein
VNTVSIIHLYREVVKSARPELADLTFQLGYYTLV